MQKANWIRCKEDLGDNCPLFKRDFYLCKKIKSAFLTISAKGVYETYINGARVGDYILPPGSTLYQKRFQYQQYDVTNMLKTDNSIVVQVANGWYKGKITYTIKTPVHSTAVIEGKFYNLEPGEYVF